MDGKPYLLPFIVLRTSGCSWQRETGGCLVCNYSDIASEIVSEKDLLQQVEYGLDFLHKHPCPFVVFTATANMFDDTELPPSIRQFIFRSVAELGFVRQLYVESRAEFIDEDKVVSGLSFLNDVQLEVGIGLETSNDWIRKFCLHKGMSTEEYVRAIQVLQRHEVKTTTYIFLKPPFLTEREAIEDALASIRFALEIGSDLVILMLSNIQPNTLTHYLWKKGRYRVPWLWSAIHILSEMIPGDRERVRLAGLKSVPTPLETAHNCPQCTTVISDAIDRWRMSGDFCWIEALRAYPCSCREQWQEELAVPSVDLEERVRRGYETLFNELLASNSEESHRA